MEKESGMSRNLGEIADQDKGRKKINKCTCETDAAAVIGGFRVSLRKKLAKAQTPYAAAHTLQGKKLVYGRFPVLG